jgi:hypothetical protein
MYGSSNVLIKDVICDNHYRNGISPINFKDVTIENCAMINTWGHPGGPCVGVDFEPDYAYDSQINGKMINCYLANNSGGEIQFFFRPMDGSSAPVDIQIKHCFISGRGSNAGVWLGTVKDGVKGAVSFEDCITESASQYGGLCSWGKSANSYLAKFTNCQWQNSTPAIGFLSGGVQGGLNFVNCTINEPNNVSVVRINTSSGAASPANISGNIKVNCPYGALSNLGGGNNVTLQLTANKSAPPKIALVKPDKGIPAKVIQYTAGELINISAGAYDPDIGFTDGAGIIKVDFTLWRGDAPVASYSDVAAPYAWPVTTTTKCPRGIYMIRITAYSSDGSFTVAVVPIYIFNTVDGTGPYITGSGIDLNHETLNIIPGKDFLIRNTSQGFMIYSPFATDSRITITDSFGRQVALEQTAKGKLWSNILTPNKFSNNVYFVQTIDKKGNNSIFKKMIIAR